MSMHIYVSPMTPVMTGGKCSTASPVLLDVEKLENLYSDQKKKRSVQFSDEIRLIVSPEEIYGLADEIRKRERNYTLFNRIFVIFILALLIGFTTFIVVECVMS